MSQSMSTSLATVKGQDDSTNRSFLKEFKLCSGWIGLLTALILIPFSIKLPFTWVQGLCWGITCLPVFLSFYPYAKSDQLTRSVKFGFTLSFLAQLGLLILLILGFFWDAAQTPSHLHSHGVLTLRPFSDGSSDYLIETNDTYQVFSQGDLGPRLFSYPKSKTSIRYQEGLPLPTLETFSGCSHHWMETLINHLFDLDEHLSLQKTYQLTLPNPL